VPRERIVCLPGFLGDARVFEPFARIARSRYEVIALDLPLSGPAPEGHYLCGSYGGLVAAELAVERLRSLALVATLPGADLLPSSFRFQAALVRHLPGPLVERLYRNHSRRSLAADGADLQSRGLDATTLRTRLDRILHHRFVFPPVPTLWILGATDPQAPTAAEVLARQPHAEVCHVPGGHRPYASHSGPLLTELERWWACVG